MIRKKNSTNLGPKNFSAGIRFMVGADERYLSVLSLLFEVNRRQAT